MVAASGRTIDQYTFDVPTCLALNEVANDVKVEAVLSGHVEDECQLGRNNVRKVAAILSVRQRKCTENTPKTSIQGNGKAVGATQNIKDMRDACCWVEARWDRKTSICKDPLQIAAVTCRTVNKSANCSRMSTFGCGAAS